MQPLRKGRLFFGLLFIKKVRKNLENCKILLDKEYLFYYNK